MDRPAHEVNPPFYIYREGPIEDFPRPYTWRAPRSPSTGRTRKTANYCYLGHYRSDRCP